MTRRADVAGHFAEDAQADGEEVRPCAGVGADEELEEERRPKRAAKKAFTDKWGGSRRGCQRRGSLP